ncbi:MAG: alpha/beta hydrolase [Acidimicrobiia bacterium]|nr:alpha/beta hydrolase [Acidimicrobiia bacterium]
MIDSPCAPGGRLSQVSQPFEHGGGTLVDETFGPDGQRHLVFLHGWGLTRDSLRDIAILFQHTHRIHLIDLPGFGDVKTAPADWGTPQYADLVERYLASRVQGTVVLVGHSFGGRVALRLAARRLPNLVGVVLLGVPGLPNRQWTRARLRRTGIWLLRRLLAWVKPLTGEGPLAWHTRRYGSRDYLAAGPLRSILVRTVNEDLTESARASTCPFLLIYGTDDTETPPWLGFAYRALMPDRANLDVLPHKDHHLYRGTGSHLCAFKIRHWLATMEPAAHAR